MDETKFILDTMRWSFSRLNAFHHCRYEWKLHYIDVNPAEDGAFSEYGSLMHEILERYAKGKLSLFELNDYYDEHFNEKIVHDFPPNKFSDLRQSYYEKGKLYLEEIDLDFDKYEVLGVEKRVEFQIAGKDFVGYIDLLLKDKETDEIIILDHKSTSLKVLKNGSVSKQDAAHFLEFKRQLYMYSMKVIEEYGRADKLVWNMFKDQKWISIPWSEQEYKETIVWAENTLKEIEHETEWSPSPSFFYCNYLCGQRNHACEYKAQPESKAYEI